MDGRLVGLTFPSEELLEESPIVTSAVGCVSRLTATVAAPPASVVTRPEFGVSLIATGLAGAVSGMVRENSEVLLVGSGRLFMMGVTSVAVAVTMPMGNVPGKTAVKLELPLASVVTVVEPRKSCPSAL